MAQEAVLGKTGEWEDSSGRSETICEPPGGLRDGSRDVGEKGQRETAADPPSESAVPPPLTLALSI